MHPGVSPPSRLGRYTALRPIRTRGGLTLASARRSDGMAVTVLVPEGGGDPAAAVRALAEIERVHGLLRHPLIPGVVAQSADGEPPFLELACDAVVDGIELMGILAADGLKVPHGQCDALVTSLREALEAAHATTDPVRGGPICIGRISHGNILFSRSGRWWLVGLGHDFPCEPPSPGSRDAANVVFQAPEVAIGAPPTPAGDYVALLVLSRSLLPYIEMNETVARLVRGEPAPGDVALGELLQWFERFLYARANERPSVAAAVEVSQRIRDHLGVQLDPEGFARTVATLLDASAHGTPSRDDPITITLHLPHDAAWLAVGDGERQRLGRPVRRILVALLDRHRAGAGAAVELSELLQVGWPDERPSVESGANRVYVTLARIRAMGLRDAIERFEGGYRLAPSTVVKMDG